ncbi:SDR family NAD(P)-dependent oxidoreductase [Mariniphaga sediminis]|uniref:SDR family NAD(P)-dependent oxidoreductase n=1 Tax=Mariniphaga sediminis TaxID=1628158 RepID=UPI0035625548
MKVLITGGTNGMGKGVAKVLADADNQAHEIVILCRSKELGEALIKELNDETSNNKISIILCDLTKFSDVKRAIIEMYEKHEFLDGIFINAGLGYAAKRIETEDGFDAHFQVNYLSQFMLTLNLLDLLKKSKKGGRVIFNVTRRGEIFWDDMQMEKKWSYERGIHQAMVAKRMLLVKLHRMFREIEDSKISFIGFEISKTVWSNQINIIPGYMRIMVTLMKFFGTFISIEECGRIMKPLFVESQQDSLKRSGTFITWKKNQFMDIKEDLAVLNKEMQDKLWKISLELCADEKTNQIAESFQNR